MKPTHVSIGLINPKSPTNVGSVMRAAGCFQVDEVFYTGERYPRAAKFHTDTHSASEKIPLTGVDDLLKSAPKRAKIICIELVEGATPLPDYSHPQNAIYIFGAEDGNISQKIIDKANDIIYIPTIGCLNLAATVNIVLYDRLAKSDSTIASDDLIRKSRDPGNKTRVKK